jgi:hypothetical protein
MTDQILTFRFPGSTSGLVAEIRRLQEELKRTKAAAQDVNAGATAGSGQAIAAVKGQTESTKGLGGSVTELASKYFLVTQALQAVMGVGKAVYGSLIQQNVELQQQLLGTQSSLAATNKVIAGGVEITDPTKAIQALEGPVNAAVERIRKGSLELVGVTSAELIPIFQNIAGQSGQIGASLEDSAELTLKFAAALGTLNIPLQQQRQEISSIIQGNITQDSILAKTLNISNAQVQSWKAQGTVVAELNKRLETFKAGNALAAQTIGGISSNIQELFQNITLEAGKPLTEEIAKDLGDFYKFLNDNKDEIQDFVTTGADALLYLIRNAKDAGSAIADNLGPVAEQLGPIFEKLGPIFETVVLGLEKIAIKASELVEANPALKVFLAVANGALTAVQAIGSLNGEFAAGTEAAEIYGQKSAAVANEAIAALGKIKAGDADATKAKTEAIAKIEDQLRALKESNVVGDENRAVIKNQIAELEVYKGKLEGAGGAVKLVSKDTQQLTNDLKLLNENFEAQGKSAELATARLTAAVKRARASSGDGAISARTEQAQLFAIEQEGLNARLKLAQEKEAGIAAIAAKGGDAEQQKEFTKQLTAAQTEQAKIEGDIADKQVARRKAIQDLQLKDLETYQARAADAIAASETALQIQIENRYQADLTDKQRYELEKLAAAQDRIAAEIAAEESRAQALRGLKFDDPDEREANEAKIRASKQRTASLTLKLLEGQRQLEEGIAEYQIKQLSDRAAAEKRAFADRSLAYEAEKASLDRITASLERQTKLRDAQSNLAKAQSSLTETSAGIETAALDRALELRKRLNDATTSPEVRRVLQQQLQALTGNRGTTEVAILQRKFAIEDAIAKLRAVALIKEQQAARENQKIEFQRYEIASKLAVITAKNAEINAKTALAEAKRNLTALQKTPGADPTAIADAAQAVREAQQNVGDAGGNVRKAQEDLAAQKPLADAAQKTLAAQQLQALAQQQAADYARQQAEQLTIVEAKSKAIAAGEKGVKFTADDFKKIEAPKLNLGAENERIIRGALPANAPLPIPGITVPTSGPSALENGSQQLKELIDLAKAQVRLGEATNANLNAIATRRPSVTFPPAPAPTSKPQEASFDGLPI